MARGLSKALKAAYTRANQEKSKMGGVASSADAAYRDARVNTNPLQNKLNQYGYFESLRDRRAKANQKAKKRK